MTSILEKLKERHKWILESVRDYGMLYYQMSEGATAKKWGGTLKGKEIGLSIGTSGRMSVLRVL
jgi:hypothetical protein